MKTCSIDGCNNHIWSKGLCQAHSPRTPLKKTPFRYTPKEYKGHNEGERRNNFFISIWKDRPHVCEHCGRNLGSEPLTYMFDHILEKKKYPNLKWEPENILLVCLPCHDNKSRGNISVKYQEKINFALTKFNVS